MSRMAILGGGELGNGARDPPGASRADGSTVGARSGARGRNGDHPDKPALSMRRPAPDRRGGHIIDGRGAGQRAVRRRRGAFARTPRGCQAGRAGSLLPMQSSSARPKGWKTESLRRMSQVIEEETDAGLPVVVLSGPSFAAEVARGLPAAVLAASTGSERAAARVQEQFRGPGCACTERRCGGGRDRRRAEERDRDRRRRGGRAGARPQCDGRAHHAWAGRDLPARVRRRRASRYARRVERSRRSRRHVHG